MAKEIIEEVEKELEGLLFEYRGTRMGRFLHRCRIEECHERLKRLERKGK